MKEGRVVLVPYPALGHVSPMQKLACAFVRKGFEAVIVLPQFIHNRIFLHHSDDIHDEIKWVALPDGLGQESPDFFVIESAMENTMPSHLQQVLEKLEGDGGVTCLVVDLLASWAIEVGLRVGIPHIAGFWPAMLATYFLIAAIPHFLLHRIISDTGLPIHGDEKICFGSHSHSPEQPLISTQDLPWLIGTEGARKARFKFWKRCIERSRGLRWLLVNSFANESETDTTEAVEFELPSSPRVLPIAPITIPLSGIDGNPKGSSVSFWEEDTDMSCLKWLATQKPNSVVYISFGSWVGPIGEAKLKSLALALEASKRPFIWVLRSSWRQALPLAFLDRVVKQGRGMIISWAPQTQVLQHRSVACFVTHCGWNSILEALQVQKKLLCYPLAGDQFLNCAYVVQVWRVGLKLNGLGPKDLEEGIVRLMEDEDMGIRLKTLRQRIMGFGMHHFQSFLHDLQIPS